MNTNNVIEINGRKYDAVSGMPLDGKPAKKASAKKAPAKKAAKPAAVKAKSAKPNKARARAVAPAASTHRPQGAKTLMRHAVRKPVITATKSKTSSRIRASKLAKPPLATVARKASVHKIDVDRLQHATRISQSHLIHHFSDLPLTDYIAPSQPVSEPTPVAAVEEVAESPRLGRTEALLAHAIKHANSHEQPHHPVKHRRTAKKARNLAAASLVVALLIAFVFDQNLASMRLHHAAAKAGFAAQLPGYKPAGFSLGAFTSGPGSVAIHFRSNANDGRNFAINEAPTNWTTQALYENYVINCDQNYAPIFNNGHTIYVDGAGNATWVSGKIWYRVSNQGALSTHQFDQLADSV